MSAVGLALRLSLRMADGTLSALPRFTDADDPLRVRAHLLAFYELRDQVQRERADLGSDADLRDRVALASIGQQIEDAIEATKNCLRRMAKRGGRGAPPTPGCRGGAPAVEGHGCPALASPAVGPAPMPPRAVEAARGASEACDIIYPDDRFSAVSGGRNCRADLEPATVAHLRGDAP